MCTYCLWLKFYIFIIGYGMMSQVVTRVLWGEGSTSTSSGIVKNPAAKGVSEMAVG